MTADDWLTATDPTPMLVFLGNQASVRKLRLFAVACCRRAEHLFTDERTRKVFDVIERYCDGDASTNELELAVFDASEAAELHSPFVSVFEASCYEMVVEDLGLEGAVREASIAVAYGLSSTGVAAENGGYIHDPYSEAKQRKVQADLLRDLFSPFSPPHLDPSLRTSTVLALAARMYASRDFTTVSILADALQDSGCDDALILEHLRGENVHVRGCWVVDAVLGKS